MGDDDFSRPIRLMNFVSEDQLAESKKNRGPRVEDGTAQRDRPLFEVLRENKDKKDAEFNEKLKHRPPKALDEDETEFLDNLEMSRKEYEKQIADEEAQQLRSFQAAIAAQSEVVHELKEPPPAPKVPEPKAVAKKNRPLGVNIVVKPQAKKAKTDITGSEQPFNASKAPQLDAGQLLSKVHKPNGVGDQSHGRSSIGLVSYSDESDDD